MPNQGEYQIKITSVADLAAVEQARAEYQRLKATLTATGGDTSGIDAQLAKLDAAATSGQAAAVRALEGWQNVKAATAKFGGDTKGVDAEIAKLQATLAGSSGAAVGATATAEAIHKLAGAVALVPGGGGVSSMLTAFAAGGVAGAGMKAMEVGLTALASAFTAVKDGLDQYAQRQSAIAKVDQQLANSGRLTAEYRQQIQDLADTFSKVSGIDDTTWLRALGKIQSRDSTSNLAANAELLKNMAAKVGDVDTAATLLSRALGGNFQRLELYGFHVDQGASKTEKLKSIMEQAAKSGAGVYEASLQTLTGQKQRLHTATHQLWEGVGRLAFEMGLGGGTARRLGDAVEWLTSKLPKADPVLDATANKTDGFSKALEQATGKSIELGEHSGDPAEGMNTTANAADKLAEKLAKATKAIDDNVAATLRQQDADLAQQLAAIDLRSAELKEKQGGKLTPAQEFAFGKERIDARQVAKTRQLDLQVDAVEKKIDETQRAAAQPTKQLAEKQAEQRKADTGIVTAFERAGVGMEPGQKPAEQVAEMDAQRKAGLDTLKGYKKDLADLQDYRVTGSLNESISGEGLIKLAGQEKELKGRIAEMEAAMKPLDAVLREVGDLARVSKDAEPEIKQTKDALEKLYSDLQTNEAELKRLRTEQATAKIATLTQTVQEQTKATEGARAEDKKRIEEAIKLNKTQLEGEPEGPRKERFSREQRQLQAAKVRLDILDTPNLARRQQIAEQAEREGFKVRNLATQPVVTTMTPAEFLSKPTNRPVQTVTPTEPPPLPAARPQTNRTPTVTRPADNAPEAEVLAYRDAENARREQIAREQARRTGVAPGFRSLPRTDSAAEVLAALREEDQIKTAAAERMRVANRPAEPAPATRASRPPAPTPPPVTGETALPPAQVKPTEPPQKLTGEPTAPVVNAPETTTPERKLGTVTPFQPAPTIPQTDAGADALRSASAGISQSGGNVAAAAAQLRQSFEASSQASAAALLELSASVAATAAAQRELAERLKYRSD